MICGAAQQIEIFVDGRWRKPDACTAKCDEAAEFEGLSSHPGIFEENVRGYRVNMCPSQITFCAAMVKVCPFESVASYRFIHRYRITLRANEKCF
jgi:hypothetical protein